MRLLRACHGPVVVQGVLTVMRSSPTCLGSEGRASAVPAHLRYGVWARPRSSRLVVWRCRNFFLEMLPVEKIGRTLTCSLLDKDVAAMS